MAYDTPTIRTGRKGTFILSVMSALVLVTLAVGNFMGATDAVVLGTMESIAVLGGSLFLLAEVFMEGKNKRKGIFDRDWELADIVSAVLGAGFLVTGLSGLAGSLAGTPVIGFPEPLKGFVILLLPTMLLYELFTE